MLTIMPKHKGTDKLRAGLRKRISKLKSASQAKKSISKRDSAFNIDKEGGGQVVVVGPANVGKSALVATLTNANPEVADFPLTTWKPTPGMMPVENIQIQLVDTPPLNRDYLEPELLNLIRRADLILLVVDLQTDPVQQLEDTVILLEEHRIVPRHLQNRYTEQRTLSFIPYLVLANKNDDENTEENLEIFRELLEEDWPLLSVSAETGRNLELLKETLVEKLKIIRVYSKAPGKEPDLTAPFVLKKGSTVEDFAGKVHKDFVVKLKIAKVWGDVVYDGQMVQRDHILQDGDVVELHI
jgi:ribosome-interacting GTPase 1